MITLKEALEKKTPVYANVIIERFMQATGCEFTWENLTKSNMSDFVAYEMSQVTRNTARLHCALLKATIGLYDDKIEMPSGWRDLLTVKKDLSQQVYLTDVEIQQFIDFAPSKFAPQKDGMEYVYVHFLLGCLTGARHSDFLRFTEDNISGDGFLTYVSIKTHTQATIPVAPLVKSLVRRAKQCKIKEMADNTFNRTLRTICQQAGICSQVSIYRRGAFSSDEKYKFISSHTARRTFATNLYLRGADLYSISKMMGHSSVDMTAGYICCGLRNLSPKVLDYFEQFT